MDPFETALAFTLKEEGGFTDNPKDHGGATNQGITQATYDQWCDSRKRTHGDVRTIPDQDVKDIYRGRYWLAGHCADLPLALGVCHFDWCVNHGVGGAIKTLQQTAGVTTDGVVGPKTLAALRAQDPETLWRRYEGLRRDWYRAWVGAHEDQAVFLKGWLARVDRLDSYVEGLG